MAEAYHHEFWLAITAAAPIIALGYAFVYDRWALRFPVADETGFRFLRNAGARLLAMAGPFADLPAMGSALESLFKERDSGSAYRAGQLVMFSFIVLVFLTIASAPAANERADGSIYEPNPPPPGKHERPDSDS